MGEKITILGSGGMGTACALLLAEVPGRRITMWARDAAYARELQQGRENTRHLPGVRLPDALEVTADIDAAMADCDLAVAAIPTKHLRGTLAPLAKRISADCPIVSVIKGIENGSFMRPSEILTDVLGGRAVVAMGGPSHAEEISRRLPASVVAASEDMPLATRVQELFNTERFRVYTNPDIVGVELAGALKNVVAIAAGICDGLGYGDNAKSALMTRGLVEMTRFGTALGADASTFAGLAGIGDLITTCISPHGRNRHVGVELGRGRSLDTILNGMQSVAEGVTTTKSVYEYAERYGVSMPIASELYQVLFEGKSASEATESLMSRPPRSE